jgi:hypothetical protein
MFGPADGGIGVQMIAIVIGVISVLVRFVGRRWARRPWP